MKLSAKDIIRMLMRISNISYATIAERTGYNQANGAMKVVARDSHVQLNTYGKFLKVFNAKLVVRYPFPDGTTREVEVDLSEAD